MVSQHYCVMVDVEVQDDAALREYALKRASQAGMSFEDFGQLEGNEEDRRAFYLGWAFDNGTPDGCGFEIQQSNVEGSGLCDASWGGR